MSKWAKRVKTFPYAEIFGIPIAKSLGCNNCCIFAWDKILCCIHIVESLDCNNFCIFCLGKNFVLYTHCRKSWLQQFLYFFSRDKIFCSILIVESLGCKNFVFFSWDKILCCILTHCRVLVETIFVFLCLGQNFVLYIYLLIVEGLGCNNLCFFFAWDKILCCLI